MGAGVVLNLLLKVLNSRTGHIHHSDMGRLPKGELLKLRLDMVPMKNTGLIMDLHRRVKLFRGVEGGLSTVDDEWCDHKRHTNEEITYIPEDRSYPTELGDCWQLLHRAAPPGFGSVSARVTAPEFTAASRSAKLAVLSARRVA